MIKTNIPQVIARLESAKRRIPESINSALAADRWHNDFVAAAERALHVVAESEAEVKAIPDMLASIRSSGALRIEAGMKSTASLSRENPKIPREELLEWVANHKTKKADRDFFKSDRSKKGYSKGEQYPDEWIASRVMHAILEQPEEWLKSTNPEGLKAFLGLSSLPPESVERLLLAVSVAWTMYATTVLPEAVRVAIRKSFE